VGPVDDRVVPLVLGPRHDGSPDRLSGRFRLGCLGKDELTDPGVQTLGADHEVVGASRVVRKDHVDSTVVVVKAFDGDAESHGRLLGRHRSTRCKAGRVSATDGG
jgi:hypothetical protein